MIITSRKQSVDSTTTFSLCWASIRRITPLSALHSHWSVRTHTHELSQHRPVCVCVWGGVADRVQIDFYFNVCTSYASSPSGESCCRLAFLPTRRFNMVSIRLLYGHLSFLTSTNPFRAWVNEGNRIDGDDDIVIKTLVDSSAAWAKQVSILSEPNEKNERKWWRWSHVTGLNFFIRISLSLSLWESRTTKKYV